MSTKRNPRRMKSRLVHAGERANFARLLLLSHPESRRARRAHMVRAEVEGRFK